MQDYVLHMLPCKIFAHWYLLVISLTSYSFRYVDLSFMFILVCMCIATVRKRISLQYMCVSTCTFVSVHPWVPSERCEINRNIDRGLIYDV